MPEALQNFIDPHDGVDQGKYRYAVARMLRLLIRARLIQEPVFFNADDRKHWKIEKSQAEEQSLQRLLQEPSVSLCK